MREREFALVLLIEHGRALEATALALRRSTSPSTEVKETTMPTPPTTVDFEAIKARQQGTWSSGD